LVVSFFSSLMMSPFFSDVNRCAHIYNPSFRIVFSLATYCDPKIKNRVCGSIDT
jgi:hypothetical protein